MLLAAAVLGVHLWLGEQVVPSRPGDEASAITRRIDVAFVRELQPAEPPPPPPRRLARTLPAAGAAIAPVEAASAPAVEPAPPLPLAEPMPALAAIAEPAAAAAAALVVEPAASAPAFEWPPSTRLSYVLGGNYRGPVEGQARVEWAKRGTRYQVVMEASVGPPFAPLMTRRASSEGEVTPEGLAPRRYDEETRVVLREPRRVRVELEPERIRLHGGRDVPRAPGVQDSASQFVQLTWLFTMHPELLARGSRIELPLALPRSVQPWIYDVQGSETLATPAGPIEAVHVKPRREATRAGGDLVAEMWIAPALQYLPVRIVVRQDADTWIDLLLERLPQQENPPQTPPQERPR